MNIVGSVSELDGDYEKAASGTSLPHTTLSNNGDGCQMWVVHMHSKLSAQEQKKQGGKPVAASIPRPDGSELVEEKEDSPYKKAALCTCRGNLGMDILQALDAETTPV